MYVLCICMYIGKIGGDILLHFKKFQLSHPVVDGHLKMSHPVVDGHLKMSHPVVDCYAAVIVRPPVEVLVRILYY